MEALASPGQLLWIVGLAIVFMVASLYVTASRPAVIVVSRIISLGKRLDTGGPFSFVFDLGCHILIAGMTGFGKSNEINFLLSQLCNYEDVQFILCSAKGGSDFLQWLPRASHIAVGAEATDMAVDMAIEILRQRYSDLVPEADITTDEGIAAVMAAVRKVTITKDLPLIVFVLDEFVEYLNADRKKNVERSGKLHTLVTLSRAIGIDLIFATQRPSQYSAPTDIRENMPYHIGFRMDKNGTEMVFGRGTMSEVPLNDLDIPGNGYGITPKVLEPTPFIAPECEDGYCRQLAWASARLRKTLGDLPRLVQDKVKG